MKRSIILLVAMLALAASFSSVAQASPAAASCSNLAYLTASNRAAEKASDGLDYADMESWRVALIYFNKAYSVESYAPVPCRTDYKRIHTYALNEYRYLKLYAKRSMAGDLSGALAAITAAGDWGDKAAEIMATWD
jgi:hypothetical protein